MTIHAEPMSRRDLLRRLGSAAAVVPLLGFAGGDDETVTRMDGRTMGTTWSVTIAGGHGEPGLLRAAIERTLERVNRQMSPWRPDSELSRFNAAATTGWFEVSPDTRAVVDEALRVARLTGGAFDLTVGRLVDAWGFGPPAPAGPPDARRVGRLLGHVDHTAVTTRDAPAALAKRDPAVAIDLCGIAKGFGLDRVGAVLDRCGVSRYLVEIGGELRARGERPGGGPWRAGIERPVDGPAPVLRVVRLADRAVATSGDYRRCFERDGVRYAHVIDPRTGRPVTSAPASVSVIAATAMQADALSTALMVLGEAGGWPLALRHGLAALFVTRRDAGFVERWTPAFDPFVEKEQ